mgnify:FL=1
MVNKNIVLRLLNNIEGYINELKMATDINYKKFMNDIRTQRFVERTIHIMIEACFDAVHHIISDEGFREPSSYADAFMVLAENNVLDSDEAKKYILMAQFRNKLVHYYEKIDPEQVFAIYNKHLVDIEHFISSIRSWLDKNI